LYLFLIDLGKLSPVIVDFNGAFEAEIVDGGVRDDIYVSITDGIFPFRDGALVKLIGRRFSRVVIFISEWKASDKGQY